MNLLMRHDVFVEDDKIRLDPLTSVIFLYLYLFNTVFFPHRGVDVLTDMACWHLLALAAVRRGDGLLQSQLSRRLMKTCKRLSDASVS